MDNAWASPLGTLRRAIRWVRMRLERATTHRLTLVAVSTDSRYLTDMRITAIQERWNIRFASTIEHACGACFGAGICVVAYDGDLPGVDWRQAVRSLSAQPFGAQYGPVLCIVSHRCGDLRGQAIACGAYDLASKPFDRPAFANLARGAFQLALSIDEACAPENVHVTPV